MFTVKAQDIDTLHKQRVINRGHQSQFPDGEVDGAEINPFSSPGHLHPSGVQIADKSIFQWNTLNFTLNLD